MNYKQKKQYRLPNYDYASNGYYFVTINAKNREQLFGENNKGIIRLSELGNIAEEYWKQIPKHYSYIQLDEFVIMPEHIHGIVIIQKGDEEAQPTLQPSRKIGQEIGKNGRKTDQDKGLDGLPTVSTPSGLNGLSTVSTPSGLNGLSTIPTSLQPQKDSLSIAMRNYKSAVTSWSRENNNAEYVWQTRFHDHIIRNEKSLNNIRQYIIDNPMKHYLKQTEEWDIYS